MITISQPIALHNGRHGRKHVSTKPRQPPAPPKPRIPRIAKLMAIAIHLDRLLQKGRLSDLSEAAELAHVTQPRMTQIMNLNHLAPDIQEELLFLPATTGRESIHEKLLRPVAAEVNWRKQRELWENLKPQANRKWLSEVEKSQQEENTPGRIAPTRGVDG